MHKKLRQIALRGMEKAYAPYSGFMVGAALLSKDEQIYCGCNIESITFTPTVCAERVAIFTAIADGKKEFSKIFIITEDENLSSPCGVCLQVLSEFCDDGFQIILANKDEEKSMTLRDLLPRPFRPNTIIGKS